MISCMLGLIILISHDPLEDLWLFTQNMDVSEVAMEFSNQHIQWLNSQSQLSSYFKESNQQWINDAKWCYSCWNDLYFIKLFYETGDSNGNMEAGKNTCRILLQHLRYMLGDEAYFAGRIPPPVPIWQFRRID